MGDCATIYPSTADIHPVDSGEEFYVGFQTHGVFVDLSGLLWRNSNLASKGDGAGDVSTGATI